MKQLLEKTRRINRFLQAAGGEPVNFGQMAETLSELLAANVYIIGRRGRMLGYALVPDVDQDPALLETLAKAAFPLEYAELLNQIEETSPNLTQGDHPAAAPPGLATQGKLTCLVPIKGAGDRLGTLIVARFGERFDDEDLILAEYGATVVGTEILRARTYEREADIRAQAAVEMALSTLSYSELEAARHVLGELNGTEGLLVASKIADRVGITRSVIVNALRKLESAGVVESRSLGMKGTHIKILNEHLIQSLTRGA